MFPFVNLTPHPVSLLTAEGETLTIPPSGTVARVSMAPGKELGTIEGVPLFDSDTVTGISGLPAPQEKKIYIVSAMMKEHVQGREDVVLLGTGPMDGAIRNERGHIVAVTRIKLP